MKRRMVLAADEPKDNGLENAIADLEADFEYIISGLEKLSRSGPNAANEALAIAENISNDLARHTDTIASAVTE